MAKIPVGIGAPLIIGPEQFVQGMASSDYSPDGGIGTSSHSINPQLVPGVIYATASPVDCSTNVTGRIIATSQDSQATVPEARIMVDDEGAIYSFDGSTATKRLTGAKTYSFGVTDIVPFAGYNYASSTGFLAQINTSAWSWTEDYKTFADASAHHPLLPYEQHLWIGDGNLLKKMTSGGTVTTMVTFDTNEKIVALGIDQNTGLMLISVQTAYNPTGTIKNRGFVYLYNGYNSKPSRKVICDDLVTAFYPVGAITFVGHGQTLGVWNGSGVSFLRKLTSVTLTQEDLPYKHHFANIGSTLFVVDGLFILAYGNIMQGQPKAFWNVLKNIVNNNKLGAIANVGNNKLSYAFATDKLYTVDISSSSAGSGLFVTPKIVFPKTVFIRKVRVVTTGITTTAGLGSCRIIDHTDNVRSAAVSTFVVASAASPRYTFDFEYGGFKTDTLQVRGVLDTQGFGITHFIVYWDPAE